MACLLWNLCGWLFYSIYHTNPFFVLPPYIIVQMIRGKIKKDKGQKTSLKKEDKEFVEIIIAKTKKGFENVKSTKDDS